LRRLPGVGDSGGVDKLLEVRLLGRLAFEFEGQELTCPSQKAMWMAAYVLANGGRHERSRLAALLWGGAGQRLELGSLRVALTKLPAPVAACLDITRDAICAAHGAKYRLDTEAFVAECGSEDTASLESAIKRYAGELLQGVPADTAPEFSDWLHAERTRLRELAHWAHFRLAQRLHAQGESHRARAIADAWLRQDPASESMHRLLITWHSQGGGTDQALAQYEVYRRARAVALGAAPSEEMAAVAERLRHGRDTPARDQPGRLSAATSFIGRTEELAQLRGLLADPACRLLTLHGLGGVGKTRLASALADLESASFPGGVHVVALDSVFDARLFSQTLARACGLQPAASADPLDVVASYLRDRTALLVLDNLEQLLGEPADAPHSVPAQVAALLRGTGPRLKILATSREPLRLQEEWVFGLDGLDYPREEASSADSQALPAVQFFAQRARQAYLGFSLAAELPNVTRICALLEGLPLGLELAASWVRSVPCAEIASSLASRAADLRSFHVNRADRHRSLGAVVAYS
jgi:DNA-binding SARP family transcriptional activator